MKASLFLGLLLLLTSIGCSFKQINAYPELVGHRNLDRIIIGNLQANANTDYQQLTQWAKEKVEGTLPSLRVFNYWDANYKMNQQGLELPRFDSNDTTLFDLVYKHTGAKYLFLGRIVNATDNAFDEARNPNYEVREAVLQFRLIDTISKREVWRCLTRVRISPLIQSRDNQNYYRNATSSSYAINKAYRLSVKKLLKALDYYPQ